MGWYSRRGLTKEDLKGSKSRVLRELGYIENPISVIKEHYRNGYYSVIYRDLVKDTIEAMCVIYIVEESDRKGYFDIDVKEVSIHHEAFPVSYHKYLTDLGIDISNW